MIAHILGFVAGILMVLALFALLTLALRSRGQKDPPSPGRGKYDERQKLARGRAFRAGFITVICYEMLYGFADLMGLRWCVNFTGILIGLFLGLAVFAVMAIVQDAYLAINERMNNWLILCGVVVFANGSCVLNQAVHGELVRDGMLTENWLNGLCAALFVVILCAQLIHNARARRAEAED